MECFTASLSMGQNPQLLERSLVAFESRSAAEAAGIGESVDGAEEVDVKDGS